MKIQLAMVLFIACCRMCPVGAEEPAAPGEEPPSSGDREISPPHAKTSFTAATVLDRFAPEVPDFTEVTGVWSAQGPGPIANGQVEGMTNKYVCGAIHTVIAHPTTADIVYIGAVNGGVWKTTNATAANPTWTTTMDGMPSLSIGALAFDPLDATSATVWAGVGRFSSYARLGGSRSGLYRTTDAGATWTNVTGGGVLVGKNISGLVVRGNTILVSVNTGDVSGNSNHGVWRSTNGGSTFTQMAVADGTGPTGLPEGVSYDIVSSPAAPDTIYTCIALPTTSSAKGIYKSTDLGATWTRVSPPALNSKITSVTSNIEMSVGGVNNVAVGILESGAPVGIFQSTDAGANWQEMDLPTMPVTTATVSTVTGATNASPIVITTAAAHGLSSNNYVEVAGVTGNTTANGIHQITVLTTTTFSLDFSAGNGAYVSGGTARRVTSMNPRGSKGPEEGTPDEIAGGQGSIHFSILADPNNANLVYVGGDRQDTPFPNYVSAVDFSGNLWRGDVTLARNGASPSSQWKHLTHSNSVAGIPGGGTSNNSSPHADSRDMAMDAVGNLLEVDDGGVFRRTSPQNNTGAWTSMAGNLQVTEAHNVTYDTVSNIIITGNQDNGTSVQDSEGSLAYTAVSTGDGGDVAVAINPANGTQSVRYSSFQNLGSFRRRVMSNTNTLVSQNFPVLAPTGGGPSISGQFTTPVEINTRNANRLLIGGSNGVFESLDQGATVTQISTLSPSDGITSGRTMIYGGVKSGVSNEELVYFARSSSIYRRAASGVSPAAVAGYTGGTVRSVIADSEDHDHLFAIDSNQVFRSTDGGATFTDITGDIPAAARDFRCLEFIRTGASWAVVVGSIRGVYAARSGAITDWAIVGTGMPNTDVWDMDYDVPDNLLVVSTLGRGVWKFSNAATIAAGLSQTITFNPIPDQITTSVLTLTATGGASGNPVTFAVTSGPATLTGGNQLSFTGAGSVTIRASQAGNADYLAAPDVSRTFTVSKAPATVTLGSLSHVFDGNPKSATAITNPSGKAVTMTYNGSSTPPTGAGTYTVVGTVNDAIYQGSATGSMVISKASQTITFNPIADQSANVTLILTATGGASGNPVTFTVVSGPAVITGGNRVNFTGMGSVTITANQATSANYLAAAPVSRTFTVIRASQTITFDPIPDHLTTESVSLEATLSSGLPVIYSIAPGPASISGNVVNFNGSGSVTITASHPGDAIYLPAASISRTFTAVKDTAVVTLGTLSQTYDGSPKVPTASTEPLGKTVVFTYNGSPTAPTNAGSYAVAGSVTDPMYHGTALGTLEIAKAAQSINFASIPDRMVTQPVTLSAIGGASGQPVLFELVEGPATIGAGNLVTFSGAGRVSIRATQAGNSNYEPATPVTRSFHVSRSAASLSLSNLSQVYSGVPSPVTVTTNPAGLKHAVLYAGLPVVPVEPGSYTVIAFIEEIQYEGDVSGTLVIAKAPQLIVFPAPPTASAGSMVSLSATGGASGNPVTFEVVSGPGVISAGNQLSFSAAGSVVVRARQAGSARFLEAAPVESTVVVSKSATTVTLGNLDQVYDGSAKTAEATTNPSGLAVSIRYNGSAIPPAAPGEYPVVATVDDPRYEGSSSGTLSIGKAAQSIDFPQPPDALANATIPLAATGGGSGNPVTFAVSGGPGSVQGGNQLVFSGSGSVTVTASQAGDGNHLDAPPVSRTLLVSKAAAASLELTRLNQVFDGSPREVVAVTQPPGLDVTITYEGSSAAPTGTGNYSLLAEIDDPIYKGSTTATLLVDDPGRMIAVSGGSLPAVGPIPAVEAATFLLGRYEVTWGVWRQVRDWAAGHGYDLAAVGTGCADDHPVRGVSWFDAVKWCNARTEWENVLLGRTLAPAYRISGSVYRSGEPANAAEVVCDPGTSGYRLPDHAERLYAARGGSASTGQPYPGGSDPLLLGWHAANANAAAAPCDLSGGRGTQPAGFLQANELGFHDLAGNVAEWTGDSPEGIPAQRARAGGDWDSPASALLLSAQSGSVPTGRSNRIGLRLARSVSAALAAALDGAGLEWDSGGTAPWFAQTGQSHDTLDAAAAGPLTGIEANWIETTANGPANLTFRWKSRLPAGSGALIVLRDGIEQSRIHGSTDWTAASVYLPAGSHVVRWRFERTQPSGPPPAAVNGENGAWLDDAALVPAVLPQVVTDPASGITDNSATGAGQVTDDGGSPVTARGLVLATSPAPVLETGLVFPAPAGGNGPFVSALAGLTPGTTYSLRAYATNEVGTAYGTERRLTTDEFVPLINGTATRTRIIASGDRQVFHFTLSGPREAVFATTGGAALRAELLDESGRRIRSFEEDGDFSLGGALYPGNYSLHVFRGPDADGPQSFNLSVDATVAARSQPDVAAGPGLSSLVRADVVIFSQNASPVAAVTTVANAGRLPDRFRVSGTRGNQFFAVTYQSVGGGIITSTVVAGRHETALLALGDAAELVRIRVVPNRQLLRKTSGGRTVTIRRTHAMSIRATSVFDRVSSDSVSVSVRTR